MSNDNSNNKEQIASSKVNRGFSSSVHCSLFLCSLLLALCFFACSSPPKRTGEVFDTRKDAEEQLQQGTREADRGNLTTAMVFINEAKRLAVLTDSSRLLIRSDLSLGNVLFSLGRTQAAAEAWNKALEEAEFSENREYTAVCRIHIARGKLLSPGAAESVRDEVSREMAQIKSEEIYTAFAWTVIGLAEKDMGRHAAAEDAVKQALAIHEKALNFELAAYDWFMIASFRSLSGDSAGALNALERAIEFDRRTENSWGLANDWQAYGDVQKKAGNRAAANAAYARAATIFRATGNGEAADKALARRD